MIDGGVIAAHLAVAAARGERYLDRAIDSALDRLSAAVAARLGSRPHAELARNPRDPVSQERIGHAIATAARGDHRFARELADAVARLDRGGARVLVNEVRAGINVQTFGGGNAHVGDYHEGDRYTDGYGPGDELILGRGAGRWVAAAGLVVALSGVAWSSRASVQGARATPSSAWSSSPGYRSHRWPSAHSWSAAWSTASARRRPRLLAPATRSCAAGGDRGAGHPVIGCRPRNATSDAATSCG